MPVKRKSTAKKKRTVSRKKKTGIGVLPKTKSYIVKGKKKRFTKTSCFKTKAEYLKYQKNCAKRGKYCRMEVSKTGNKYCAFTAGGRKKAS